MSNPKIRLMFFNRIFLVLLNFLSDFWLHKIYLCETLVNENTYDTYQGWRPKTKKKKKKKKKNINWCHDTSSWRDIHRAISGTLFQYSDYHSRTLQGTPERECWGQWLKAISWHVKLASQVCRLTSKVTNECYATSIKYYQKPKLSNHRSVIWTETPGKY